MNGKWSNANNLKLILLVGLVSSLSCQQTEVRLDSDLDAFYPRRRVGVRKISLEQSRVINYFGFKNINAYGARLDFNEIQKRGGRAGEINDITLIIEKGRIVNFRKTGTQVPDVDDYIEEIVKRWQAANYRHFTEFIDRVEMVIKLNQGGTIEIVFLDFEVQQPNGELERYKFFNNINRDVGNMYYIVPLSGFRITNVRTTECRAKFVALENELERWEKMQMPDGYRRRLSMKN